MSGSTTATGSRGSQLNVVNIDSSVSDTSIALTPQDSGSILLLNGGAPAPNQRTVTVTLPPLQDMMGFNVKVQTVDVGTAWKVRVDPSSSNTMLGLIMEGQSTSANGDFVDAQRKSVVAGTTIVEQATPANASTNDWIQITAEENTYLVTGMVCDEVNVT